jgi:hypothetical protein
VFSNANTAVIHLTKLDPTIEEWGDFDWNFVVLDRAAPNYVSITNTANNYQSITNDPHYSTGDAGTGTWNNNDYSDYNAGGGSGTAEKACPVCTLLNPSYNSHCSVCGNNL